MAKKSEAEVARTKHQVGTRELISRSMIKNAPYNPRKITKTNFKRLQDSIKKHGLVGSIAWNRRTGNLVGGHQRLAVLDVLEKSQDYSIEVDVIDVDELDEKAINVVLNNRSAQGDWNFELLEGVIEELVASGVGYESAGFSHNDINILFPDKFLLSEEDSQAQEEMGVIAQVEDIKRTSAEFEPQFQANASRNGFMPNVEGMEDDDGVTSEEREIEQSVTFRDKKKSHAESADVVHEREGDTVINLVFQDRDQLLKFIELYELDPRSRMIGLSEIERIFDIDLR